jgi:hypothetical protein
MIPPGISAPLALPNPAALIITLRGCRVILDGDLAALYGVTTKALNQAVKRNGKRFPDTFAFQVAATEWEPMRSQNVTASKRNVRFLPWAFTEHGALMVANVLNSDRAVQMSVELINAFIRLRQMALSVEELARKVDMLERGFREHGEQFQVVFDALRQLLNPPDPPRRKIGF